MNAEDLKIWRPFLRQFTKKRLKAEPWRVFMFLLFFPLDLATPIFNIDRRYICSAVLWSMTFGKGRERGLALIKEGNEDVELDVKYWGSGFIVDTGSTENIRGNK